MKYLLGSDIHGSVEGTKFLIKKFKDLKCDKLLLLGDYLGGGYKNDQKVIDILNKNNVKIRSTMEEGSITYTSYTFAL